MGTFFIKQNDTSPAILATLLDGDEQPINLTLANVRFHLRRAGTKTPLVDAEATIVTPLEGIVRYDWQPSDTAASGVLEAEFEVTYNDLTVETFPNTGYITVEIISDIA